MEIPDPKFKVGDSIISTPKRYGPKCPDHLPVREGQVVAARYLLDDYGDTGWEYDVKFGWDEGGVSLGDTATFGEETLLEGIRHEHDCNHATPNILKAGT